MREKGGVIGGDGGCEAGILETPSQDTPPGSGIRHCSKITLSHLWWLTPVIPELRKLRLEDWEPEGSLGLGCWEGRDRAREG